MLRAAVEKNTDVEGCRRQHNNKRVSYNKIDAGNAKSTRPHTTQHFEGAPDACRPSSHVVEWQSMALHHHGRSSSHPTVYFSWSCKKELCLLSLLNLTFRCPSRTPIHKEHLSPILFPTSCTVASPTCALLHVHFCFMCDPWHRHDYMLLNVWRTNLMQERRTLRVCVSRW